MEVHGGGDESETEMKTPHSPSGPPSDDADWAKSTASTEDDDYWTVSDDEEEDEDDDKYHHFTVDDFPRVSSDHCEQSDALYLNSDIQRGPPTIRLFRAFNVPLVEKHKHCFGDQYQLYDESEINVNNNITTVNCSHGCRCNSIGVLQFIDLKIAGYRHAQPACAKIFGFFAARDGVEPLRNYVYRRGIDNYEAVNVNRDTGIAHLSLTSPARCICMICRVFFEFKLCVRTDDQQEDGPKDDLLIEGCTEFVNMFKTGPFIEFRRLYGEKCGLDMKFLVLQNAVQAKLMSRYSVLLAMALI
ncbi:hypothetical protein ZWY2020_048563 [Hordeum vulgare]|nr:hypothetical protein ZWY2020_048563 [Hordeum vulgare]